ncbi:MAG TPA: HAD-IA family hydrolase, partial [Actinomycetes bacterium]
VRPALEWLAEQRIPVAIVSTNATRAIRLALKVNEVDHLVSVVLGRADQGFDMARLKPNPSLVHDALAKVNGGPALLVGDSIDDMVAGERAGLATVGVTTGERSAQELKAAGADVVIPSFGDLRSVFRTEN